MDDKTYYGTDNSQVITYLEFGEIDIKNSKKKIWNFQLHQRAYDWLMLGRYANDLQSFVTMKNILHKNSLQKVIDIYNEEIHHEDEASLNLAKVLSLSITKDETDTVSPSFYELGQTIFGCIEGMDFYKALLNELSINYPEFDLKEISWFGVDISQMFNQLSETFHREYNVKCMIDKSLLPKKVDVFFSKGITLLYAVRSVDELFKEITKGKLSIFDYSFSIDKEEDTTIGSGKTVRYLKLYDFLEELKKYDETLYVKKSNSKFDLKTNRIWLDCLFAKKTLCKRYIELDCKVREELFAKLSGLDKTQRFLNNDRSPEWIPIHEFISAQNF